MPFYNRSFLQIPLIKQQIFKYQFTNTIYVSGLTLFNNRSFVIRYNTAHSKNFITCNTKLKNSSTTNQIEKTNSFTEEQLAQAKKERLLGLSPFVSRLPEKWIPYAELMRLEKPVGTWLLYIPCTWSILMGSMLTEATVPQTLGMLTIFGLGSLIMRGAGCTINDICDRNLDNKVIRSIERPIASGKVTVKQASVFLAVQTLIGCGILTLLPTQCWWLGLASLPIVFTYPLFKRFTYYPQAALSACFTWGALLGFPAMGIMAWSTMLPLYLGSYLWCMIYDTIYAHQDKKFDIKAGIKSTALTWGPKTKKICYSLTVGQFALYIIAGINSGLLWGPGFIGGLSVFAYRIFTMIKKVDLDNPKSCWKAFLSNINSGLYFTFAIGIDYILKVFGIL